MIKYNPAFVSSAPMHQIEKNFLKDIKMKT